MKSIKVSAVLTAMLCGLTCTTANATSWRVNHDLSTGAHFASIGAAMSSENVLEGDTLYLDPGLVTSETATINKQVTIIGTGYLRASSPHQFANVSTSLTITAEGTKIEGLWCGNIYIRAANVTIERCYSTGNIYVNNSNNNIKYTGILIRQCYIVGSYYIGGSGTSKESLTNATIENNILISSYSNPLRYLNGCTVRNNYIRYTGTSTSANVIANSINCTIYNNILLNNYKPELVLNVDATCTANNNIYSSSTTDEENHNLGLGSADESLIFVMSGNNDERYSELKEGSPAIGYGVDGADCGPTGGLYPYVVSGLPAYHPYYTNAVFSKTSDGTGVNVSLKIKMQNE